MDEGAKKRLLSIPFTNPTKGAKVSYLNHPYMDGTANTYSTVRGVKIAAKTTCLMREV